MTVGDVVKAIEAGELVLWEVLDALTMLIRKRGAAIDAAVRGVELAADVSEEAKLAAKGQP